jgi:hypothetical protein
LHFFAQGLLKLLYHCGSRASFEGSTCVVHSTSQGVEFIPDEFDALPVIALVFGELIKELPVAFGQLL